MADCPAQDLLAREMRVSFGAVPHGLDDATLDEAGWHLAGDEFLMRTGKGHGFHYRKGQGVMIEREDGADAAIEALWLSGSVYSAVASINGFLPIHASAVCHDGRVHAFTGPSGAGKSTLVTALSRHGLALFADDTLVLDLSDPDRVICLPGHKRLKLTEEALALTGAEREEQVSRHIEKFYAEPPTIYSGGALPFAQLVFLEEADRISFDSIRGAERVMRLHDDHYTAFHFAAARRFDAEAHFDHVTRLARQIEMHRFCRPIDQSRFDDGVALVRERIVGYGTTTGSHDARET